MKDTWQQLLEKVKAGATLYLSLDDAYLPTFNGPIGIEVHTNAKWRGNLSFLSKLTGDSLNFTTAAERKLTIDPKATTVLATEEDGNPVFLKATYGAGTIYLLTFPLEDNLTRQTGAFDKAAPAYATLYRQIAGPLIAQRVLTQSNSYIGNTEQSLSDKEKIVILINYSPEAITTNLVLKNGWKIGGSLYGNVSTGEVATIKGNDAVVLRMVKN